MDNPNASLYKAVRTKLLLDGKKVKPSNWQGVDVSKKPEMESLEIMNFHIEMSMVDYGDLHILRSDIKPNLPWADDHFEERVGGKPLNPGEQWKNWPWGNSADRFRGADGKFSHTYMERMWPRFAGYPEPAEFETFLTRWGIRYRLGDVNDLLCLLVRFPFTRQAYLPIWFPEDTGATDRRVPCSLGYHFMLRGGALNMTYFIRSCDLLRHFRDDVYLAIRLCRWVRDQLQLMDSEHWHHVELGKFNMFIGSLHIFTNDETVLHKEIYNEQRN